jgi:DNA-binding transcriptional ArsR family regulator
MKTDEMTQAADRAVALLRALAHRHRLLILCHLAERERSVGELAELVGARESTISQHLALLRRDGLVATRREGQTIWYALASAPARTVVDTLYRTYCGGPSRRGAKRRAR